MMETTFDKLAIGDLFHFCNETVRLLEKVSDNEISDGEHGKWEVNFRYHEKVEKI